MLQATAADEWTGLHHSLNSDDDDEESKLRRLNKQVSIILDLLHTPVYNYVSKPAWWRHIGVYIKVYTGIYFIACHYIGKHMKFITLHYIHECFFVHLRVKYKLKAWKMFVSDNKQSFLLNNFFNHRFSHISLITFSDNCTCVLYCSI